MTDALKVGDRVRKKQCRCSVCKETEGVIIRIRGLNMPYLIDSGNHSCWHKAECLQKLPDEETMTEKKEDEAVSENKELKLEVGKPYVLKDKNIGFGYTLFPIKFICNLKYFGFDGLKNYMFIQPNTNLIYLNESEISRLKEHREPHKNTIDSWIEYDPNDTPGKLDVLDTLTGLAVVSIYDRYEKAIANKSGRCLIKKFRFTAKELPIEKTKQEPLRTGFWDEA